MGYKTINNQLVQYRTSSKAVFARSLYLVYNMLAIWRATIILQNNSFLLLTLLLIPQFVETAYTLVTRHSLSHKWFNPSALCFLLCGIPCIWLMEFKLLQDRLQTKYFFLWIEPKSASSSPAFGLSESDWAGGLEQFLVFICIAAKWIAPKGNMSDHELSELLIIFITNGADTTELLEIFGDDQVQRKDYVSIVCLVLTVWSWSMLQFVFELTSTKKFPFIPHNQDDDDNEQTDFSPFRSKISSNTSLAHTNRQTDDNDETVIEEAANSPAYSCHSCFCFYNEIWAITVMLFTQDIPYFICRLYIFAGYRVTSQLNLFFLFKNLFLLVLHLYRIAIVHKNEKAAWTEFRAKVLENEENYFSLKQLRKLSEATRNKISTESNSTVS